MRCLIILSLPILRLLFYCLTRKKILVHEKDNFLRLERKIRLDLSTVQRYDLFIAVNEFFSK